ncbi:MAG: DUF86 domain-containing protein [Bacteroidota bacterium]|nr:DUF86 domain-containing protein [Bacteroidota bacterium]
MTREEEQYHITSIINEINEVQAYTTTMDQQEFEREEETQSIVARSLRNIGEAAVLLSTDDDWQDKYEDVDLNVLQRLQDSMYNNEMEFAPGVIWSIIKQDLPEIKRELFEISENLDEEEDIKGIL